MVNRIDKDTEVTVVNNTHGSFSYNFKGTLIELDEYGDEDYLTFGELKTMSSSAHKGILKNLMLLITDIDSDEFTVNDVINQLKLRKFYDPLTKYTDNDVSVDAIEAFIIDSKEDEFEKALKEKSLSRILIEGAVTLYKKKELTDYDKLRVLGKALGVKDFNTYFSDIAPE